MRTPNTGIKDEICYSYAVLGFLNPAYAQAGETSHFQFAKEYIRELAATENRRASAEHDIKDGTNQMMSCIRSSTSFKLELGSQISAMNGMHLNAPFDSVPQSIVQFYQEKID